MHGKMFEQGTLPMEQERPGVPRPVRAGGPSPHAAHRRARQSNNAVLLNAGSSGWNRAITRGKARAWGRAGPPPPSPRVPPAGRGAASRGRARLAERSPHPSAPHRMNAASGMPSPAARTLPQEPRPRAAQPRSPAPLTTNAASGMPSGPRFPPAAAAASLPPAAAIWERTVHARRAPQASSRQRRAGAGTAHWPSRVRRRGRKGRLRQEGASSDPAERGRLHYVGEGSGREGQALLCRGRVRQRGLPGVAGPVSALPALSREGDAAFPPCASACGGSALVSKRSVTSQTEQTWAMPLTVYNNHF